MTELGLGETEYRSQLDSHSAAMSKCSARTTSRPGMTAEDPRAYNKKSVGSRMMIVSAGVIMNVILAAIGFMIVYMIGYPVPPATVGSVVANSPAARAVTADGTQVGLQPGDVIVSYNGKAMDGDFSRIPLNVALTAEGTRVAIVVKHPDGSEQTLYATPQKPGSDGKGLLQLGVSQPYELAGPEAIDEDDADLALLPRTDLPDILAIKPGDVITQINGKPINPDGAAAIAQMYAALLDSQGSTVDLTIKSSDGHSRQTSIYPHFSEPFSGSDMDILGLVPRAAVASLLDSSPALDKLKPGDAIVSVDAGSDHLLNPTCQQIRDTLAAAGDKQLTVSLTVLDPNQAAPRLIENLTPYRIPKGGGRLGLGISLFSDERHLVVAQTLPNSAGEKAKIPAGATLVAVDGQPITNWFQLRYIVANAHPGQKLVISYSSSEAPDKTSVATVELRQEDIDGARAVTLTQYLPLHAMTSALHTHNPLVALGRGVEETRDLILQFYVTLQRMVTGDVGINNMMGPVGMAREGAQVASRGIAWLLWFLSLISANLAVVNFLPIPIVDGGLFTLLILEKIQGKPLSPDAQRIVQMVGLVLILGVFLLVTYQDIARWAGY
jgi:regulator of sigma E protease